MKKIFILVIALCSFTLASAQVHAPHVNYRFTKSGQLVSDAPTEFTLPDEYLLHYATRKHYIDQDGNVLKRAINSLMYNSWSGRKIHWSNSLEETELPNGYMYDCVGMCHHITIPGYGTDLSFDFKFSVTITKDPFIIKISKYRIIEDTSYSPKHELFGRLWLAGGLFKKDGTVKNSKKAQYNYELINTFANAYMNAFLDNLLYRVVYDFELPTDERLKEIFNFK